MISMLACILLLASCADEEEQVESLVSPQAGSPEASMPTVPSPGTSPTASGLVTARSCTSTSNCTEGEYCINGRCGTVPALYDTDSCSMKCNFRQVHISTSDGENYTLNRGQGSYTAAGSVQWKILSGPAYCPGGDILIPLIVTTSNYGKVLGDEVVALKQGETSKVFRHPFIKSFAFNLTVNDLEEVCT